MIDYVKCLFEIDKYIPLSIDCNNVLTKIVYYISYESHIDVYTKYYWTLENPLDAH